MGYTPLFVKKYETGLVQSRQEFILPEDAFPILENMYVWRERIRRRQGTQLLGRLRRRRLTQALGSTDGFGNFTGNLIAIFSLEASSNFQPGSIVVTNGGFTFTDNGLGVLVGAPSGSGTINYATGDITITGGAASTALVINFNYYPSLPAMGLRSRELNSNNNEQMVAFDTKYAYVNSGSGFIEFIPGTTWTGNDSDFFWSTNYWVGDGNRKIFWVTNFSGISGDPIRYTNGTAWADFAPTINASSDKLHQCLAMLPFRSRMVTFNTLEGQNLSNSVSYPNRIRWAAIGNPFSDVTAVVTTVNTNAWRDDIRGQGGYLDIPTSEDIISVGFVRDNLVIYCERSTWQLRYTGRSIAPFQIEKVNSELGAESTFSAIQFDTSLVGIGDKGVVECDSFKSARIDIKIPDLVFEFNNEDNGPKRVHGIRDFQQKLAYWIYSYGPLRSIYPNRRLVYNYENDSWAIFTDSLTCLGNFQNLTTRSWASSHFRWRSADFPWVGTPALYPNIVGGNQQGYVVIIGSNLTPQVTNDESLYISDITGNTSTATSIESPAHNMETGQVIQISGIPDGTDFSNLNDGIFSIVKVDADNFLLYKYSPQADLFIVPQLDPPGTYIGGGQIKLRDNFSIWSKKFNFLEQGEKIQIGFIDMMMVSTVAGAIALNIFIDYADAQATNIYPQNENEDVFFNSIVPTSASILGVTEGSKVLQRVYCATRANFIALQFKLSNSQMIGVEQKSDVQIDSQVIWMRKAGRLTI